MSSRSSRPNRDEQRRVRAHAQRHGLTYQQALNHVGASSVADGAQPSGQFRMPKLGTGSMIDVRVRADPERATDYLDAALDAFDTGHLDHYQYGDVLRDIAADHPDAIDVWAHLANLDIDCGRYGAARVHARTGFELGLKEIRAAGWPSRPANVSWGWLQNRPFMRAAFALMLADAHTGKAAEALALRELLLSVNPNDNQGVRDISKRDLSEPGRLPTPESAAALAEEIGMALAQHTALIDDVRAALCAGAPALSEMALRCIRDAANVLAAALGVPEQFVVQIYAASAVWLAYRVAEGRYVNLATFRQVEATAPEDAERRRGSLLEMYLSMRDGQISSGDPDCFLGHSVGRPIGSQAPHHFDEDGLHFSPEEAQK